MNAPRICKLRNGVHKNASISSFFNCQRQNKDHCALVNYGEVEFLSLVRRIYDCKLRNEKQYLIQVCNEYSPQTSTFLHNCQLKSEEVLLNLKGLSEDGVRADSTANLVREIKGSGSRRFFSCLNSCCWHVNERLKRFVCRILFTYLCSIVVDRHRFDADLDPDPTFHFDPIKIRILPQVICSRNISRKIK
jgi:hypothetical protein